MRSPWKEILFIGFIILIILRGNDIPLLILPIWFLGIFLAVIVFREAQLVHRHLALLPASGIIASLAIMQYILPVKPSAGIFLAIMIIWLIGSKLNAHENRFLFSSSLVLAIFFCISLLLNPRAFHAWFRSSTYEAYIRSMYPEHLGLVADYLIDRNKPANPAKAIELSDRAQRAEKEGRYEEALKLYNRSVDLNPRNAKVCHLRGFLKLNHFDLNPDVALSAIKDFDRAIRLDTNMTLAYFHRSLALGYLNQKSRGFLDRKKVWERDRFLDDNEFSKRYGTSKELFFKPFYP